MLENRNFTIKSEITLHNHFTQLIYTVRHSLYPLSTQGTSKMLKGVRDFLKPSKVARINAHFIMRLCGYET